MRSSFEVNKFLNISCVFDSVDRTMECKEPPAPCSVLSSDAPPPSPPDCPPQRLTREQLLPPTPSVQCDKKYAFSPQLQEFCLKHPIAVVRGIAAVLKLGKLEFSKMNKNIWTFSKKKNSITIHQLYPK